MGLALDIGDFVQDPSWAGGGMIVLGVVTTILPGIPNVSAMRRVRKVGKKVRTRMRPPGVVDDVPGGCFPAGTAAPPTLAAERPSGAAVPTAAAPPARPRSEAGRTIRRVRVETRAAFGVAVRSAGDLPVR